MSVSPSVARINDPRLPEKFWRYVYPIEDGCWIWAGILDYHGYGHFRRIKGKGLLAHRQAYLALIGPIPEGLECDHLCRRPACVNPAHIEPVTHRENIRRAVPFRPKTGPICKFGHVRDQEYFARKHACKLCRRVSSYKKNKKLRSDPLGLERSRRYNRECMRRAAARKKAAKAVVTAEAANASHSVETWTLDSQGVGTGLGT